MHGWWEEEVTPSVAVETGSRLALCKMDWDRVDATDVLGRFTIVLVCISCAVCCAPSAAAIGCK